MFDNGIGMCVLLRYLQQNQGKGAIVISTDNASVKNVIDVLAPEEDACRVKYHTLQDLNVEPVELFDPYYGLVWGINLPSYSKKMSTKMRTSKGVMVLFTTQQ